MAVAPGSSDLWELAPGHAKFTAITGCAVSQMAHIIRSASTCAGRAAFLPDELRLELSQSNTLITHAASQAVRFLGYQIRAQHSDTKITRRRRAVNGAIGLFVPKAVIRQRCALYMKAGKPAQRGMLLHDDDFYIVAKYQAEYAGLVQYYLLAQEVFRLGRLHQVMETSLLKTLAGKSQALRPASRR
jgi:hypothetical protein